MFRNNPKPLIPSTAKSKDGETKTKPHLAYSVVDAAALIAQGKPISNQQVQGMYYDGQNLPEDYEVSLPDTRGVDINDVWAESQRTAKVRKRFGVHLGTDSVDAPQKGGK